MRGLPLVAVAAIGVLAASTTGCLVVEHEHRRPVPVVVQKPGPPPHAPAHGYRRKHQQDGVELVFDSGLGVYVVVGQTDCWWDDDHYYRWRDGVWLTAVHVSGPWSTVEVNVVPGGLRTHKGKAAKGKGRSKAKGSPASPRR
jgi:hypothetical protein